MLLTALVAAEISQGPVQINAFQLTVDGSQPISCASAFTEPVRDSRASAWILVYWTGLNVSARAIVGHGTDTNGLLAEIKLDCDKEPSADLLNSVFRTWKRLQKTGR